MVKICQKCGTENSDDSFWCVNCKTRLIESPSLEFQEPKPIKQNEEFSSYDDEPEYDSIYEPPKNRTKIILLILVLIGVVSVVIMALSIADPEDDTEKFIGSWKLDSFETTGMDDLMGVDIVEILELDNIKLNKTIIFESDGTCLAKGNGIEDIVEIWHLKDRKLHFSGPSSSDPTDYLTGIFPPNPVGWDYKFSHNDNHLDLIMGGGGYTIIFQLVKLV